MDIKFLIIYPVNYFVVVQDSEKIGLEVNTYKTKYSYLYVDVSAPENI